MRIGYKGAFLPHDADKQGGSENIEVSGSSVPGGKNLQPIKLLDKKNGVCYKLHNLKKGRRNYGFFINR
jgi:hypothetical protein